MRPWIPLAAIVALAPAHAAGDTLGEALALAYQNNPALLAARANARAADETFVQARAGFLPQVSAFGTYGTRKVETETVSPVPGGAPTKSIVNTRPGDYGVEARQEIFSGGRRIGQVSRANATIEGAQEALRSTEQQVFLSAVAAYVDVRRDTEFVSIRSSNVEVLVRQLEEANARFDVGEITKTDVAQSQARLAGARAQLAQARANLEASRARYAVVIGVAPNALEAEPPPPALPESLDSAVEAGLKANPDYLRLKHAADAAKAQITIDRADLLPNLSIVGRYDRFFDEKTKTPLAIGDVETATATAQLSIPLYEGGLRRSVVAQSRQEYRRAAFEAEAARREVINDVTAAWNDLEAAKQVIVSSREQVQANELAFEGAEQERQVGLRTTLDVLNAQQELLDSRLTLAGAQRNAYVAAHALLSAVGGLDGKTLAVNAPLYDPDKHRRAVHWRF